MSVWEIVILVVVCVAFAAAVGVIIYNKIKGKSGCDCGGKCGSKSGGCGDCPHCAMMNDNAQSDAATEKNVDSGDEKKS